MLYNDLLQIKLTHYNVNRESNTYPVVHHQFNLLTGTTIYYYDFQSAENYSFSQCTFVGCTFGSADLRFDRCTFIDCQPPYSNLTDTFNATCVEQYDEFGQYVGLYPIGAFESSRISAEYFIGVQVFEPDFETCIFRKNVETRSCSFLTCDFYEGINAHDSNFNSCNFTLLPYKIDCYGSNEFNSGIILNLNINDQSDTNLIDVSVENVDFFVKTNSSLNLVNSDISRVEFIILQDYLDSTKTILFTQDGSSIITFAEIKKVDTEFNEFIIDGLISTEFRIGKRNRVTFINSVITSLILEASVESVSIRVEDSNGNFIRIDFRDDINTIDQAIITGHPFTTEIVHRIIVGYETVIE